MDIQYDCFYDKDESEDRFIPNTIHKLKKNKKILLTEGSQKRDYI